MEKEKRYSIYPGQIKIGSTTFFGLDYEITDLFLKLEQENQQLKDIYIKTCNHLFNIGNGELARYLQAQINEHDSFVPQELKDKEV